AEGETLGLGAERPEPIPDTKARDELRRHQAARMLGPGTSMNEILPVRHAHQAAVLRHELAEDAPRLAQELALRDHAALPAASRSRSSRKRKVRSKPASSRRSSTCL